MRTSALLFIILAGCRPNTTPSSAIATENSAMKTSVCRGPLVMSFEGPTSNDIVCGSDNVNLLSLSFTNGSTCNMEMDPGNYRLTVEGAFPEDIVDAGWLEDEDGIILAGPEPLGRGQFAFSNALDLEPLTTKNANLVVNFTSACEGAESARATYLTRTTRAEYESGGLVRNLVPLANITGNSFTFVEGECTVTASSTRPEPSTLVPGAEYLLDVYEISCSGESMNFADITLSLTGEEALENVTVTFWNEYGEPDSRTAFPASGIVRFPTMDMPVPEGITVLLPVYGTIASAPAGTIVSASWNDADVEFVGQTSGEVYGADAITDSVVGVEHVVVP